MTTAVALEVLDATVFVGCPADDDALADVVAGIIAADGAPPWVARIDIMVSTNGDADPDRASRWPGGFLYFPCVLDVYAAAYAPRHERAEFIAALLTSLWSLGIAAVAACEYEDLLPAAAGTGDQSLPWPAAVAPSPARIRPVLSS